MKLHVTSAYSEHGCLDRLIELAALDAHGQHELVSDPEAADAILFVENTQFDDLQFRKVLNHPLVARYPSKVYMYNEMDESWPVLPGLYCSLTGKFADPEDHVAFPYLMPSNQDVKYIHESNVDRRWLYSFVGSSSHPIRKQMFSLPTDNAKIVDTSDFCAWDPLQPSAHAYQKLYTDTMAASKFVLCPRGIGPASLRLYETVEAGRVPVIISDQWVAPPQVCWDFAVRVPESEISSIPELLRTLEPEWQDRSRAARAAWESAFATDQLFNSVGEAIQMLLQTASIRQPDLSVELHKYKVMLGLGLRQKIRRQANQGKPKKRLPAEIDTAVYSPVGKLVSQKA